MRQSRSSSGSLNERRSRGRALETKRARQVSSAVGRQWAVSPDHRQLEHARLCPVQAPEIDRQRRFEVIAGGTTAMRVARPRATAAETANRYGRDYVPAPAVLSRRRGRCRVNSGLRSDRARMANRSQPAKAAFDVAQDRGHRDPAMGRWTGRLNVPTGVYSRRGVDQGVRCGACRHGDGVVHRRGGFD
jgi:hypothetical protein